MAGKNIRRWATVSLSGPLAVSIGVHAVVLLALGQVAFRPATAAVARYTRIRLMQWDSASQPGRVPEVSLPGGRARAVSLPRPVVDPGTQELQRQLQRMAQLRDEFFSPMRVATMPMPVLPGLPSRVAPPPFWDVPLSERAPSLPPLPTGDDARRLAEMLQADAKARKAQAARPAVGKPAVSAPDNLKGAIVDVPDEGNQASASAQVPPESRMGEETRIAQVEPGIAAPQDAPAQTPAAPTEPAAGVPASEVTTTPAAAGTEPPAAAPEAAPGPAAREETPAGKSGDPSPASAEAAPAKAEPASSTAETGGKDAPPAATPAGEAPPDAARTSRTPSAPEAGDTQKGGDPKEAGETVAPAPAIPAGGLHARLAGSFRIPLGLALPGFQSSPSMAVLLREVEARTALKVTLAGLVSPEGTPAGAPILYVKGTGALALTDEQRAALLEYVKKGGTLFVDGVDGEFGEGIRAELERLFPGQAPQRVPVTDPVYSAHYRLAGAPGVKLFPLQAIRMEGRPAVILSASFLGRRWQQAADPEHEAAVALGVNLVVLAAAGWK